MQDEENQLVQTASNEPSESTESTERQEEFQSSRSRDQEYNWGEARRKMQDLERKSQDLERKSQEQDELIRRLQTPKHVEEDDLKNLTDDDIVTVSQAKRLATDIIRQREMSTLEDRLQSKFHDFQDVVSRDSIEDLRRQEPELAASLASMKDPYQQAIAAYKLIKRVGGRDQMTLEQKKATENRSKPQSVNTITKNSAIGNAHMFENGLTKELKAQLYKEMCQAAKGF
jgi:hypothetical protein